MVNRAKRTWVPHFIFLVSIFLTALVTWLVSESFSEGHQARFDAAIERTRSTLTRQLRVYSALLRSMSAIFSHDQELNAAEFRSFMQGFEISEHYPGIQALGFAVSVLPQEQRALEYYMRAQGERDFAIYPSRDDAEAVVVVFLEPFDGVNREAVGFDMASDPVRWNAMQQARDTATPVISGPVELIGYTEDGAPARGFHMYAPVYRTEIPPDSVEARRQALTGFVYAVFRASTLFPRFFEMRPNQPVHFQIYDGAVPAESRLLYQTPHYARESLVEPELAPRTIHFEASGRLWSIRFVPSPDLFGSTRQNVVPLVFVGGVFISLALFGVSRSQALAHERAQEAVAALHASETRFRMLFEQSPFAIQIFAVDGRTLMVNRAWEELWAVSVDDLGQYNIRRDAQIERLGLAGTVRRLFQGERVRVAPVFYDPAEIGRSGRARWIEVVGYPVRDDEGNLREVVVLCEDVTDRRLAEEKWRQSESRFRRLFESNLLGIVLSHVQGEIFDANEAFLQLTGLEPEKLSEGISWSELTAPEFHEADRHATEQLRQSGLSIPYQKEFLLRNGRRVPVIVGHASLEGAAERVVTFVLDLTELRRKERALRESEARAEAVLNSALDAIITTDAQGRILEWNPAAVEIFGRARGEVLGSDLMKLILPPEEWHAREQEGFGFLARTGEGTGRRFELEAVRKDGEIFPIEAAVTIVAAGPEPLYTTHIRDITVRRRAERELERAQQRLREYAEDLERRVAERTARLEEINQALETFSYSVSHDLRAPVRSIQGFSVLLQEQLGEEISPQTREFLSRIVDSASRMDQLISDLLAYSHLRARELTLAPVDLEEVVREALDQQQALILECQARISVEKPFPAVLAHRSSLVQVLSNLISNAIKFVPADRRPEIRIWCEPADGKTRLSIEDNGIGIRPEYQGRIFRPFERLNDLNVPGTGIGLATVQKAIERMGGTVGLESEVNRGSRFWFELNLA